MYCLVTKDETSGILKSFITRVENLKDQKVKVIRCDNGTEFKNKEMNQFCERKGTKACDDAGDNEKKFTEEPEKEGGDPIIDSEFNDQEEEDNANNTNNANAASTNEISVGGGKIIIELLIDPDMPKLDAIVYSDDDEDVGVEADMNNLNAFMPDPSWIEAMQEELFQFNLQEVWTLVDLPNGKRAIGYTQEEGIDYDEVFSPVVRIEAIRIFLAYASFKDFVVYQMDVKSAFLYGKIEEEVYLCQPSGFEDLDFPNKVYKVEKALYKSHQAPRAWYKTLSTYLLDNRFQRGTIDKTLFIKRDKGDILLVQVYVDDIIFGCTMKLLCTEFEKMMPKKFQMSFIASTSMETQKPLLKDEDAYTDSDYAKANLDRKSTIGGCQFLGCRLISWQCKKQTVVANSTIKAVYEAASSCCGQHIEIRHYFINDSTKRKLIQMIKIHTDKNVADFLTKAFDDVWNGMEKLPRMILERDLQLEDAEGTNCLPNATIFEQLTLMGFNFSKYIIDNMVKNVDNIGKFLMYPSDNVAEEALNEENVPTHSNDPLLSCEDCLKLKELMALCTNLQNRVLDLEHTKTTQALEIERLKMRVKKLEKKQRLRTYWLKRLYKVGLSARVISSDDEGLGEEDVSKHRRKIHDIDADEDITLASTHFDIDPEMFGVHDLDGDESAKPKVIIVAATITTTVVTRPMTKGLVIQEQEQASTPITSSKDKDRIAREKEEANVALIAQWNDIQDKVETDYELAQRLQAEEQEELTIEEKSKLFQKLLEKRRKHFAAKRAEERRNKPPIKAQQRSIIVNTFVDMDTEVLGGSEVRAKGSKTIAQESSLKRAGDELEQEKAKKQKIDNDQEEDEMKKLMKIVPNEEEVVGNYVKDEVWHALVVITNASNLYGYTVWSLYRAIQSSVDHEAVVRVGVWCIGEYGDLLVNNIENDVVDVIELAINRHTSNLTTRSICLIALLKLSLRFPSCSQNSGS
ncbi:putative ribonuclease H-like domain-containing protein [Tanacetum coccineum]